MGFYPKYWGSERITLCNELGIDEFVLFKDPTLSLNLCDFPSLQQSFKRPL